MKSTPRSPKTDIWAQSYALSKFPFSRQLFSSVPRDIKLHLNSPFLVSCACLSKRRMKTSGHMHETDNPTQAYAILNIFARVTQFTANTHMPEHTRKDMEDFLHQLFKNRCRKWDFLFMLRRRLEQLSFYYFLWSYHQLSLENYGIIENFILLKKIIFGLGKVCKLWMDSRFNYMWGRFWQPMTFIY